MIKYLIALLLVASSLAAYTPKIALQLAYMSNIAYESVASIDAWNCGKCGKYHLSNPKAFSNSVGDLQGFTGYSSTLGGIVLSFRGSSNIQNWIINLSTNMVTYSNCNNCKVHNGFYAGWNLAKSLVNSQIQSLRALFRNAPIYITGHSLGGALAALAAPDVKSLFGNVVALYTFGQPRVGNPEYAAFMSSVIASFRVIHYGDLVPHVPPASFGFVHQNTQIWFDKGMKTYKTCEGDSPNCSNSLPATSLNTGDHSMDTYMTLPGSISDRVLGAVQTFIQVLQQPTSSQFYGYLTKA